MSIDRILKENDNLLICVIGPHAGEDLETIFKRKIKDIEQCSYTYWICKSRVISPEIISSFQEYNNQKDLYILFIKTTTNSQGKDTKNADAAIYVEEDEKWKELDPKLSPITGKMPTSGFKFGEITLVNEKEKTIDLSEYVEWSPDKEKRGCSIQIMMGKSTLCITKSKKKQNMKNSVRQIVGYAKLIIPFCVKLTNKFEEKNKKRKEQKISIDIDEKIIKKIKR